MPTILSHALVPLAIGLGLGPKRIPPAVLATGMVAAMLPDADVIGFGFGIPYESAFGHRGASHSLVVAALFGLGGAAMLRTAGASFGRLFLFLFAAMASHGLLDTLTNGGEGVALLWPLSDVRLFAPVRPIEVSPIGLGPFLSARGMAVLLSEALWIWLPCALLAIALRGVLRSQRPGA